MIRSTLSLLAIVLPLAGAAAQDAGRSVHGAAQGAPAAQLCLHNAAPVAARITVTSSRDGATVHHTPDTVLLGQTRCTGVAPGRAAVVLVESMDATFRYSQACQRSFTVTQGVTIRLDGNAVSGVHCS